MGRDTFWDEHGVCVCGVQSLCRSSCPTPLGFTGDLQELVPSVITLRVGFHPGLQSVKKNTLISDYHTSNMFQYKT